MDRPDPAGWLPPVPPGPGGPPGPGPIPPPTFPAHVGPAAPQPEMGADNTIALVGFWIAASGAVLLFLTNGLSSPGSLVLGAAGAVCSWNGRKRIKRGETTRNSMWADVGLAVGGVCTVLSLIGTVIIVILVAID